MKGRFLPPENGLTEYRNQDRLEVIYIQYHKVKRGNLMKVVDMHCDTISELYKDHKKGGSASIVENSLMMDLKKMKAGDYGLQNFALYTNLERAKGRPFEYCMELLDTFYTELEAHGDEIGIVTSYEDIERNWRQGKMSALLAIEEGGVCQGELAFLRNFYRLGVRMMTLTWNYQNELAFPNRKETLAGGGFHTAPDMENGLTETGICFVEEMERLGMIIDISHLGDKGIWDVFRYTSKPFVASHSNARAVASHPRNLTDEMIRRLSERGGVMGINYYAHFLRDFEEGEAAVSRISYMVEHMKHVRQVGGIQCMGLGSDFDGIDGELEMKDASRLGMLADAMSAAGFTLSEIEAVFFKNVLRVYRDLL